MHIQLTPDFKPLRAWPCFCGSGQRFKNCCGSMAPDRAPPHGVHLVRGFLDGDSCRALVESLADRPGQPLGMFSVKAESDSMEAEYHAGRITDDIDPGESRERVNAHVERAWREVIAPAVGRRFAWFEAPGVMRYRVGGRYNTHADSEIYIPQRLAWLKNIDRDTSLLLYLNEEFEGGGLEFVTFNYRYRPRTGDLVFFPSDHRYLHRALPVTAGTRWVIVSWAAFVDEPRVLEAPVPGVIRLDD